MYIWTTIDPPHLAVYTLENSAEAAIAAYAKEHDKTLTAEEIDACYLPAPTLEGQYLNPQTGRKLPGTY